MLFNFHSEKFFPSLTVLAIFASKEKNQFFPKSVSLLKSVWARIKKYVSLISICRIT